MAIYHFSNRPHGTTKYGTKINTKAHFEYIAREGRYAHLRNRGEDLVYIESGNMPYWAKTPQDFWEAAETYRRVNGRAYREFHLGLQEELNLEDNKACVEKFLEETGIKDHHAYTFCIHDKEAALDSNHRNIHAHVMFCEKTIEHDRPVGAEKYFHQYREDKQGNPVSGYKVDRRFASKEMNQSMRDLWADIVNRKFKKRGIDIQISSKTLEAQREQKLAEGKYEEAEILDRLPAKNLSKRYCNPKYKKYITDAKNAVHQNVNKSVDDDWTMKYYRQKDDKEFEDILQYVVSDEMRKIGRQIQQQRLAVQQEKENERQREILDQMARDASVRQEKEKEERERREEEKREKEEQDRRDWEEDFQNGDPLLVTYGDIIDFAMASMEIEKEKAQRLQEESRKLWKKIGNEKKEGQSYHVLSEGEIQRKAENLLFGGRSTEAKKKYRMILNALKKEGLPEKEREDLERQRIKVGKECAYFNKLLKEKGPLFEKIQEHIRFEQNLKLKDSRMKEVEEKERLEKMEKEAGKLYRDAQRHQHQADQLDETIGYILYMNKNKNTSQFMQNRIYTKDKIPPMIYKRNKILGTLPLEKCPYVDTDTGRYYLFKNRNLDDITREDIENGSVKAIRENDDIINGLAPTYIITFKDGRIDNISDYDVKHHNYKHWTPLYRPRDEKPKKNYQFNPKNPQKIKDNFNKYNLGNKKKKELLNTILDQFSNDSTRHSNAKLYDTEIEKERYAARFREARKNEAEKKDLELENTFR